MPSDAFTADFLELSPDSWLEHTVRYLTERFTPETRPEAAQRLMKAAWALVQNTDEEEAPQLLPLVAFLESVGETPPSLVSEFLPSNKLFCLSGAAKEGKSLVALQILQDICRGGKMMGRFDVDRSGPVAYFGLEDGGFEIKSRLTQRGVLDMENYYVCAQPFDMNTEVGWMTYLSLIESMAAPPMLVVIDTAREAFTGVRDWNDAALVGPALKKLRRWSQKHCTVILICHNNKDRFATGVNKVSGSGALVSSCDVIAILENQKVLPDGGLRWDYDIGGRGLKKVRYKLQMDTETLEVRCLTESEITEARKQDRYADKEESKLLILEKAKELPAFTARNMADVTEMTPQYVSRLLSEMVKDSLLHKGKKIQEEGSDRPAQSFYYKEDCADNSVKSNEPDGTVLDSTPEFHCSCPENDPLSRFIDAEEPPAIDSDEEEI